MRRFCRAVVGALSLVSVAQAADTKGLVVYCPHPLEFIKPLVTRFEEQSHLKVEVVAAGTGELLKRVEAEAAHPMGDVMWGGSLPTLQPKAALFEPYRSPNESALLDEFKNTDGRITRFTVIPSVLMVNKGLIGDVPMAGFADLLNPRLKGKIAYADPAKSSSSLEHLINQLYAMGKGKPEDGWKYEEQLVANLDGKLLSGSSAVYKGVADGEYVVGLTFEEAAVNYVKAGAPVRVVYPREGTIARPDGVAIIKGSRNLEAAKRFVDFLTSQEAQTLVANALNRRSVRKDVPPSQGLTPLSEIKVIHDDERWTTDHKQALLDRFKDLIVN